MNICVFTVVYPGCERYLSDFINSLNEQSFYNFDLFILNDGFDKLEDYLEACTQNIVQYSVSGTTAEIREKGIRLLSNSNYDYVIFADADDYFSSDRVYSAVKNLKNCDILVNDITIVNENGKVIESKYFSNRLVNGQVLKSSYMIDKNVMGLSNTAVKRSVLDNMIIPPDTIAVDWMVFTGMLLKDRRAIFSNDSVTFYRHHSKNTAGFGAISIEKLKKGIEVHSQNTRYFMAGSEKHRKHAEEIINLKNYLAEKDNNLTKYFRTIKEMKTEYPFWWEEVKTLAEIREWKYN